MQAHLIKSLGRLLVGVVCLGAVTCPAAETSAVDFKEVMQVLRENLAGASEDSLNRAAVEGLFIALKGKVMLADTNTSTDTNAVVSRQQVIDGGVAYLRVTRVVEGLDGEVTKALSALKTTNELAGVVLDLRYAGGADYRAAASTVDLFLGKELPLLNAGHGLISSRDKTNALRLPAVALVNGETAEAGEALAAMMRYSGAGLLIGERTAGRAAVMKEIVLTNGQVLRVAVAPVLLGDAKPVAQTGVTPDIEVALKADEERNFYLEPFAQVGNGQTNSVRSARRPRVSEADLVREKRGEADLESLAAAREKAESATVIVDPMLSRAVDLLKGLAVVRSSRF